METRQCEKARVACDSPSEALSTVMLGVIAPSANSSPAPTHDRHTCPTASRMRVRMRIRMRAAAAAARARRGVEGAGAGGGLRAVFKLVQHGEEASLAVVVRAQQHAHVLVAHLVLWAFGQGGFEGGPEV